MSDAYGPSNRDDQNGNEPPNRPGRGRPRGRRAEPASPVTRVGLAHRRGAAIQPANRFERRWYEPDPEYLPPADDTGPPRLGEPAGRAVAAEPPLGATRWATRFVADQSRSIITTNTSPDVGFRHSVNAYRGCEHGCAYCYARPTHEYLGYSAGLDFETVILVKYRAAELLTAALANPRWHGEPIAMSGVTDCYQPIEHRLGLTRGCLKVMAAAGQAVTIVTKNSLVLRDLDILSDMAARRLVQVWISCCSLDGELLRGLEPRTTTPTGRMRAIRELACAGVPVGVIVAPVIPGLTDRDIPAVLGAAAEAGASRAGMVLLRLPGAVRPVFLDWLYRERPLAAERVESHLRATRGGQLNDARFGHRMTGTGPMAEQIAMMFRVFARRFSLDRTWPALDTTRFVAPRLSNLPSVPDGTAPNLAGLPSGPDPRPLPMRPDPRRGSPTDGQLRLFL